MSARIDRAFTLIELLVTVAVIAALLTILVPALASARHSGMTVACLANLRSLQTAHMMYIGDHDGWMLGTSHGSSWITTLRRYDQALLLRSPVDHSPHFPDGLPIDGVYRATSYATNHLLSPDNPIGTGRLDRVTAPHRTGHFVIKAFEGDGAVADHFHPHLWWTPLAHSLPEIIPGKAATEVEIGAHDHTPTDPSFESRSNYGFLDGHAETLPFRSVYTDPDTNRFYPRAGTTTGSTH